MEMLKEQLRINLILFCALMRPSQGKEEPCISQSYPIGQCDGDNEACVQSCNDDKLSGGKCGAFRSTRVCYCEGCHQDVTARNRTSALVRPSQGKEKLCISKSYLGECDGDDEKCGTSCNEENLSGGKCGALRNIRVCYCEGCHQGVTERRTTTEPHKTGGFLVSAQGPSLWRLPGEDVGETRELSNISEEKNYAVAVDCVNHHLYWSIPELGIRRSRYDGSDNHLVVNQDVCYGLAVDFVSGNIFWVFGGVLHMSGNMGRIQDGAILVAKMSHLEAGHKTIISRTEINIASALAVHPSRGSIYWSHSTTTIETASMDGSNRQVLVTGVDARSLALDYGADDLYWADYYTGNIECISLNGGDKRIVSAQGSLGQWSFGISLSGERIYWTSYSITGQIDVSLARIGILNSITKIGLKMKQHSLPDERSGKLNGIVFVPEQCPILSNACAVSNGGCPFICLPLPENSKKCVCPDGNSSCTS